MWGSSSRVETPSVLDLTAFWYDVKLPSRVCSLKELAQTNVTKEELDNMYGEGQAALQAGGEKYRRQQEGWYREEFEKRGTTGDKIASAALRLTDYDFMFCFDSFDLLFNVARQDAHHYDAALKALVAVWAKIMPSRPLKKFAAQYFATVPEDPTERLKVLCYWVIEDQLKSKYAQFLSFAESSLKDKLVQRRESWLDALGKLLCKVAEDKFTLMSIVVNKLGDPLPKLAHSAYHCVLAMLCESSTNQGALSTHLERLAFTPNLSVRAQKYCVNILNQFVFNREERKLAVKCVGTYIALFKQRVIDGAADQAVTSAILVGLRRAFPFTGNDAAALEEHIDSLLVVSSMGNFHQRVSALSLVHQIVGKGQKTLESRFYRSLYNLLLVAPKSLPQASQLTVFFAMLYKAIRADTNPARVCAFVHRLLQRCVYHSDAFVCATLLLVAELSKSCSLVRHLIARPPSEDALLDAMSGKKGPKVGNVSSKKIVADTDKNKTYDCRMREPQFANAHRESYWTLQLFTHHSHPSVVQLATLLLLGEEMAFDVHPLDDLSLANFLELFVSTKTGHSKNANQYEEEGMPRTIDPKGVPVFRRTHHHANIPNVDDQSFVDATPEEVDPSTIFIHRYAYQRQNFIDQQRAPIHDVWKPVAAAKLNSTDALFGPDQGGADAAPAPEVEAEGEIPDYGGDDLNWGTADGAGANEDGYGSEYSEDGEEAEKHGGDDDELITDANAGDDFDNMIQNTATSVMSKRQRRDEKWLDSRSAPMSEYRPPQRSKPHAAPAGRQGAPKRKVARRA